MIGDYMGVNGKNKGNTFERKVSLLLSERFKLATGLETSFRRNIDSGSFFGGSNRFRTETHDLSKASFGDIICPTDFTYNIECKFYANPPSFDMIIKQDIKQWDTWLEQAKQDAINANKKLALIAKFNRIEEIVILDQLPMGMTYSFMYKSYYVTTLTNFLALSDIEFFSKAIVSSE